MKAIVYNKKGSPEKLIYSDIEKPEPNNDEVLIKILSASLNAADTRSIRLGIIPKNKIFGADISGIVEAVGKNIEKFTNGDEVIGDLSNCGFGGFAEYVVVPESVLALKPATISFEEAAALPLAATTALQALRDKGNIKEGHKVLIVGSSGGVGTFAVQLAKYFGAMVTAVCSTKNIEQTNSLGADDVIDYTKEDFSKNSNTYDLVIVVNGNRPLSAYKRILNPNGICVIVGGALSQIIKSLLFGWAMSFGSKKIRSLLAKSTQKDLEFIVKLKENGKIKSVIEKQYSLDKTAEAIQYLNQGHAKGKVVINLQE